MDTPLPRYQDYPAIMASLGKYASPKAKLTNLIKSGKIIRIRRGLYIRQEDSEFSKNTLANKIYGPSYISFEYALSYYNLIPERVHTVTSASMGKNKNKHFTTPVGEFHYQSVPSSVYPYGIVRVEETAGPFLIAAKEKALCDMLFKTSGISTIASLENLLYEDWRIEKDAIRSMSGKDIRILAPLYRKKQITLLFEYLTVGRNK